VYSTQYNKVINYIIVELGIFKRVSMVSFFLSHNLALVITMPM
jgi:hypothetical protein